MFCCIRTALSACPMSIVVFVLLSAAPCWPAGQKGPIFRSPVMYSSGGANNSTVAVGDVNGDGKLDIVSGNVASSVQLGNVQVLLGNGDGSFRTGQLYTLSSGSAGSVALADLNGDGKLDIVVSERSNCGCGAEDVIGVLLGNGDGTFLSEHTYNSGGLGANRLIVADLNGDGKPDVAVTNSCDSDQGFCAFGVDGIIGVLLGNGDGTLLPAKTFDSGGVAPGDLTIADVNGDGIPDLLVANEGEAYGVTISSNGVVRLGNGDGTFQGPAIFNTLIPQALGVEGIAVADLNNDGKPDVVTTTCYYSECAGGVGGLNVQLGNGDGTFQAPQLYKAAGFLPVQVLLADVDLDGKMDAIVVSNGKCQNCPDGGASVLLGNGDGTFSTSFQHYSSGGAGATSAALGDLNGDDRPDLVVGNSFTLCGPACNTGPGAVGVLLNAAKFPTNVSFLSSVSPSVYGQPVKFVATVTRSGSFQPTGTVTFRWGTGKSIGGASVQSDGTATLIKSNLNADIFPLTAVYSGDVNNLGSTSTVTTQVVTQTTSASNITSSLNPSAVGQTVTFTARVTSPTVIPRGSVTFSAGNTILATIPLSNGNATLVTTSLPSGATKVTVTYLGSSDIKGSRATVTQVVQ